MCPDATTVAAYLNGLEPDQRNVVEMLRALVLQRLPEGYDEAMRGNMICYEVPMDLSGRTYNGKPLMYVAIAAQKRHVSLYLCGLYCEPALMARFRDSYPGKPDMGKACLRLRRADQIDEASIGAAIAALTPAEFAAHAPTPR